MTDFSSIAAVLGSLKTATEIAKLIKDSDLTLEKAEFKMKLAELIGSLADAKIEMAALQEDVHARELRIKELEAELSGTSGLAYAQPFYWRGTGATRDGPFCQKCYDTEHRAVRLQPGSDKNFWACRACGCAFRTDR